MPIHYRRLSRLGARTLAGAALLGLLGFPPLLAPAESTRPQLEYQTERVSPLTLHAPRHVSNQRPVHVRVSMHPRAAFEPGTLRILADKRVVRSVRVTKRRDLARVELPKLARASTHHLAAVFTVPGQSRRRSAPVLVESHAGCAWRPRACGYPDARNTGPNPRTKLRDVPGDITSGKGWHVDDRGWIEVGANAVVDRIRTEMQLSVSGDGAVISNSEIVVSGDQFAIQLRHAEGVRVTNNIIRGPAQDSSQRLGCAIKDMYGDIQQLVIARNEIRYASTGIQVGSGVVRDNYLHDFGLRDGDHVNGVTSNGSSAPLTIAHNTILNEHSQTDAVSLFQDFGVEANRRISDNLLAGGGYVIYGGEGGQGQSHHIVISGNRISRLFYPQGGSYGPIAHFDASGPGNLLSDNLWDESGRRLH